MDNTIYKKNSLRVALITRMLDEAETMIKDMGQTLEDEAWLIESTRMGIHYSQQTNEGQQQ
jgi:hypothetical protein